MCENVYCSCKHIKPLTCSYKVLFYLFLKLPFRLEVTSYSVKKMKKWESTLFKIIPWCIVCCYNGSTDCTADPWSRMFTISGAKHSSFLPNMLLRAIYTFQYIITTHQIPSYWRVNSQSYAKIFREPFWRRNWKTRDLYYYQWTMN